MKKVHNLISVAVLAIALTGCGTTGSDLPGSGYPDLGNQQGQGAYNSGLEQNNIIPQKEQGIGQEFDLSEFLIPSASLENKKVYKTFTIF